MSFSEHLNDYNKILADLKNLDVEISDEDKCLLLLNSLPDAYDHLITTLLYGKDEIKFNDVSNALTNNEFRKKEKQSYRDTVSEVLTVRGKSDKKKSSWRVDLDLNRREPLIRKLGKMSVSCVTKRGIRRKIVL